MTYLYVATNPYLEDIDVYKIGISRNPSKRVKCLSKQLMSKGLIDSELYVVYQKSYPERLYAYESEQSTIKNTVEYIFPYSDKFDGSTEFRHVNINILKKRIRTYPEDESDVISPSYNVCLIISESGDMQSDDAYIKCVENPYHSIKSRKIHYPYYDIAFCIPVYCGLIISDMEKMLYRWSLGENWYVTTRTNQWNKIPKSPSEIYNYINSVFIPEWYGNYSIDESDLPAALDLLNIVEL